MIMDAAKLHFIPWNYLSAEQPKFSANRTRAAELDSSTLGKTCFISHPSKNVRSRTREVMRAATVDFQRYRFLFECMTFTTIFDFYDRHLRLRERITSVRGRAWE